MAAPTPARRAIGSVGSSPAACHGCFPEIGSDRFLLRERFIKTHLAAVDRFVAPSRFLRQRYIDWGLSAERIEVIANARPAQDATPHRSAKGRRTSFGYFGNLNPWKGVLPLLQAAKILQASGEEGFSLRIHGGAPFQSEVFTTALDAALAGYERSIQTAFREVADALARQGTIGEELRAATASVTAAQDTARLSEARYRGGVEGYLDNLVAQRAFYTAQRQEAATRLVLVQNRIALYRALGGDQASARAAN